MAPQDRERLDGGARDSCWQIRPRDVALLRGGTWTDGHIPQEALELDFGDSAARTRRRVPDDTHRPPFALSIASGRRLVPKQRMCRRLADALRLVGRIEQPVTVGARYTVGGAAAQRVVRLTLEQ